MNTTTSSLQCLNLKEQESFILLQKAQIHVCTWLFLLQSFIPLIKIYVYVYLRLLWLTPLKSIYITVVYPTNVYDSDKYEITLFRFYLQIFYPSSKWIIVDRYRGISDLGIEIDWHKSVYSNLRPRNNNWQD